MSISIGSVIVTALIIAVIVISLKVKSNSEKLQELDELERVSAIFRSHPDYAAPETFMDNLKGLMNSGRFELFDAKQ